MISSNVKEYVWAWVRARDSPPVNAVQQYYSERVSNTMFFHARHSS